MKSITDPYILSNGVQIPCIGFGTWQVEDGEEAYNSVMEALKIGYRHVDTAQAYGNEGSVGRALKNSGVPRGDIFVTSKLANPVRGYDETIASFNESLELLGTDYMDMFLIHWPRPHKYRDEWQRMNAESWRAMEDLYKEERVRAIGISNFWPHHIRELMQTATVAPMVNQIKLCPGETQSEVVDYSRDMGMLLEAYSPLGVGQIFNVPEMKELAEKYGKSIGQIALRWSLQRGYLPLPKSVTPSRIKENTMLFDFELAEEDMERITNLDGVCGYARDPDTITF